MSSPAVPNFPSAYSEAEVDDSQYPKADREGSPFTVAYENIGRLRQLDWLNFLISHTWPQMGQLASNIVEVHIEPLLREKLPERLKGMKLSKFTIGERPGKFERFEVYDLPNGTSCVHAALDCHSEMQIEWEVKGFTFGIKDISLIGEIVFLLRPFIEELPGTGGVTVFFINPPELDFKFTGVARVAEFKGVKSMIRSVLDDVLADVLVMPNVITQLMRYSDFSLYPMVMGDPVPIGLLRIKTLKAKDLPSGDINCLGLLGGGVDDNYIKVSLGNDKWTAKVKKSALGATHDFVVYDPEQQLRIDLWDEDQYTDDDHMGRAGPFGLHEAMELSDKSIQLYDPSDSAKPAGTLVLQVDYYLGTPRTLGPVLNAIMLPIREVHMPPAKENSKVYIRAELGAVQKRSRVGVVMKSHLKEHTVASVMGDMQERLRKHGLSDVDIQKLTTTDGLSCNSDQISMAINECMTFMIPDGAGLDSGEIKMTLLEEVHDDKAKPAKKRGRQPSMLESELGRCVIRLRDLKEAPQLTVKGPALFKHSDGTAYNVEVSAFVCGFKAGRPDKVSDTNRAELRRQHRSTTVSRGV